MFEHVDSDSFVAGLEMSLDSALWLLKEQTLDEWNGGS